MLIEPIEMREGGWVIVNNPRPMTAGGVHCDAPEFALMAWDWCWTGDKWTSAIAGAKRFASREAAQGSIDGNAEMLATAFVGCSGDSESAIVTKIRHELRRLDAETVAVRDEEAVSDAIPLIRVELNQQWCSLGGLGFLTVLQTLKDGAGTRAVRRAIRSAARHGLDWAIS